LGTFLVLIKKNDLDWNRLGLIVTKKIGKSTRRNQYKRLAREFFRTNSHTWPQGLDLLFIARKNAVLGEQMRLPGFSDSDDQKLSRVMRSVLERGKLELSQKALTLPGGNPKPSGFSPNSDSFNPR
jgi:RNase P protein component